MDCSVEFVSLVERGVNAPSVAGLERFAKVLKVDVRDLFTFDGKRWRVLQSIECNFGWRRCASDGEANRGAPPCLRRRRRPPVRKPTVPTDARSEFLANRAMGDWAEQGLSVALRLAFPDWKVAQYGDTNRIAAGHPDFKASYLIGVEETRRYGKRPDLLVFPAAFAVDADLSGQAHAETETLVKQAAAAIEVRSSKFES